MATMMIEDADTALNIKLGVMLPISDANADARLIQQAVEAVERLRAVNPDWKPAHERGEPIRKRVAPTTIQIDAGVSMKDVEFALSMKSLVVVYEGDNPIIKRR